MASVDATPTSSLREFSGQNVGVDRLPEEMNDMKIKDDKEVEATVVDGNGTEISHIIVTTIGGQNGQPKQTISYMVERVVGQGSFGVVFQAKCLKTGESVVIKKVLQDKRYKNRELQTYSLMLNQSMPLIYVKLYTYQWDKENELTYTQEQIDKVRGEWTAYVSRYM